jgi:hypothetical protein
LYKYIDFINESEISDEIFSGYNGRYKFNVSKAYEMIENKSIKSSIHEFKRNLLYMFSHPEFSYVDTEKIKRLKDNIDYDKPLGLLVKFKNPYDEDHDPEWILIDGNHRTRIAAEANKDGKLIVISDPEDVKKFMKIDNNIPHELFPDN